MYHVQCIKLFQISQIIQDVFKTEGPEVVSLTSLMSAEGKPTVSSRRFQRLKLGVTSKMEEGG